MNKCKLFSGIAVAGVLSAGFGVATLPASAEPRTITVTLLGGAQVQVQVDVPPGTPLDEIKLPDALAPVIAISYGTPAAPPTPPADGDPARAPAATPAESTKHPGSSKTRKPSRTIKNTAGKGSAEVLVVSGKGTPHRGGETRDSGGRPTPQNPTFSYALPGATPIGVPNFFIAKFRIPPFLLPIYQAAGIQYGIRWEVLAAINEIETDYGRNLNVSSAGAVGWMQFMPSTWRAYGVDANADGHKDPYNPVDAVFGAARYLKAAGAEKDIKRAIFAYNHADWYVDSVLMRARLIGGMPPDLIGSLTGLTQGLFPVYAAARYADDIAEREARVRVAKGRNASIPVESVSARRSVNVYAATGSPAVAVQDGTITKVGKSSRLGRFIQLRDAYGNAYTYGNLKRVAQSYPVPRKHAAAASATSADSSVKDPVPLGAASAGSQAAERIAKGRAAAEVAPALTERRRLFANPSRARSLESGGEEQLLNTTEAGRTIEHYLAQVHGLKRSDVRITRLKVGSKVIAGTILGRLGPTSTAAPHLRFEIRPAGRGAPRIDPKPILDGWKLLESSAIYRASGKNPFVGPDARNPSIGQILLLSKKQLQRRVVANPRIDIYRGGERDVMAGEIDRRVLATVEFLAASGLKPTITSLRRNHSLRTTSGSISAHSSGNAVDIAKINGIPILGHQGPGSITDITVRRLLSLQGTMKPNQIISQMTVGGTDNTLALPDHADHIHVGFLPRYNSNSRLARQMDAVLKPAQWIKLIARLRAIENPEVLTTASADAIKVSSEPRVGN